MLRYLLPALLLASATPAVAQTLDCELMFREAIKMTLEIDYAKGVINHSASWGNLTFPITEVEEFAIHSKPEQEDGMLLMINRHSGATLLETNDPDTNERVYDWFDCKPRRQMF